MPEKKILKNEELEQVTGGDESIATTKNVIVRYKEDINGLTLEHDLGRFEISIAQSEGEAMAQEWCTLNNKIYDGYYLANLLTNNYDTRVLLDSMGTKQYN